MFYGINWSWLLLIIAIILTVFAQTKVNYSYNKYSRINNVHGITGVEAARRIMRANGIDIPIEVISGSLTDHYDPSKKVLRLSTAVANDASVASVAIAAHEVGHAIQHATGYVPIKIRGAIVPAVNISSKLATPIILVGVVLGIVGTMSGANIVLNIGIILFAVVVAFHVITLPVEFNASSRALQQMEALELVTGEERKGAKKVLSAAAMTYVAAMAAAVIQLVRLVAITRRDS